MRLWGARVTSTCIGGRKGSPHPQDHMPNAATRGEASATGGGSILLRARGWKPRVYTRAEFFPSFDLSNSNNHQIACAELLTFLHDFSRETRQSS